jgi:hypothetical protein
MAQLQLPPTKPTYGSAWLVNWIEALILFVAGVAVACLIGLTGVTVGQIWKVSAIAAGALSLGFGAAYLFQHLRQNSQAIALEAEFAETSARIDALAADYNEVKRTVGKSGG